MRTPRLLPCIAVAIGLVACQEATAPVAKAPAKSAVVVATADPTPVGAARSRPIAEFIDAQGSYCWPNDEGPGCLLFNPPVLNFFGWSNADNSLGAVVDYAGLADKWIRGASNGRRSFHTRFGGSIREQAMSDGRAIVTVRLHTERALSWAVPGEDLTAALNFGCRATDVFAGQCRHPVLGESDMDVTFWNTAPGAAIPDLIELYLVPVPGMAEIVSEFKASAKGFSDGNTFAGGRGKLTIWEKDTVDAEGNVNWLRTDVHISGRHPSGSIVSGAIVAPDRHAAARAWVLRGAGHGALKPGGTQ